MLELFQESISPLNLPFTILLGIVAVYWIIGLLGLIDFEALDGIGGLDGVEASGIEGVEGAEALDHNLTGDGNANTVGGTLFNGILKMIGVTDAPVIFIISIFTAFLWALNVASNHYLNPQDSTATATLYLIPIVIISFVATRIFIRPLRPLMNMIKSDEKPVQIIGASGTVRSATLDQEFGQVEVQADDSVLILKARLSTEDSLSKGTEILVVSRDQDEETYIVRPLN